LAPKSLVQRTHLQRSIVLQIVAADQLLFLFFIDGCSSDFVPLEKYIKSKCR
jgi:hypothetical protein